ncbi:MAG: ABC transporter ATP-binding protein [Dehalococcoidia bacterium]|nr:ABC transporter ATP-binding protein [Dehalococcoidia bacterium]
MQQTPVSKQTTLVVDNISLSFGGIQALKNVSLEIKEKEILAIIGPNGAGKTSLLNSINGFYRPQKGRIIFNNIDVTKFPSYRRAQMGIARTFQNIELYTGMTTLDNLLAARHIHMKYNFLWGALYFGKAHTEEIKHRRIVEDVIDFLEMEAIRKRIVGALPYGKRKLVELGRALALEPKLLLLDEPMAGMNVEEKEDMARFVLDIFEEKHIPIVLIEHDMGVVMDIADRVIVLDFGEKIADGTPQEVKANPRVIKAYLGVEEPVKIGPNS